MDTSGGSMRKRKGRQRVMSTALAAIAACAAATLCVQPTHAADDSSAGVDSTATTASAAASTCANASTVVVGATDSDAIAYDTSCKARPFLVVKPGAGARELNLSSLDVTTVRSYPRVYTLYLNNNDLETFQAGSDMDLSHLDLSRNAIASLTSLTPWPTSAVLQTLVLDENPITLIEETAFDSIRSLQNLSLVKTSLKSLDKIQFPASLSILNASGNALESSSSNFSNLPDDLQYLDLSKNKLSKLPTRISELASLIELDPVSEDTEEVVSAAISKGVVDDRKTDINQRQRGSAFANENRNLDGNTLTNFEICRSDMSTFASVELTVPKFVLTSCANAGAALGDVNGTPVCVVEDCSKLSASDTTAASAATTTPAETPVPTTVSPETGASVLNNGSSNSSDSVFSSKAIVVIGGISFFIGILVSAFGFVLYRKRKLEEAEGKGKSRSNYLSFVLEQRTNTDRDLEDESDDSWVFDNPHIYPNAVALLEEDDDKRKKPGLLDDLLVFEIPPEEIKMQVTLPSSYEISSMASQTVMFLADYQGYQVVLHALLRQKKNRRREERRFIEQIRLASAVEHPSMVQFIGLTFGTTSQQHQQQTQRWKFAVVFEYMHKGSLASMFQSERSRREGKLYYGDGNASTGGNGGNLFSWFPSSVSQNNAQNPDSDWRCKLSIALDIAMGLVYLHASQMVHGNLKSTKVLVNDHGEAKLSALDLKLPGDSDMMPREDSIRQSAKIKMKKMIGFKPSSFTQSQLGNSLLHGGASEIPTTPGLYLDSTNPKYKETKDDIYAFGVLLWELDTMLSIDTMKNFSTTSAVGEEHNLLKFTNDCPGEIKHLARRCWNPDVRQRPDALDLQEELVQLLEGRITTSSHAVSSWLRTTNLSMASSFSSSNMSSSSVYALSESEADV